MRECYHKREVAHQQQDKNSQVLAEMRRYEHERLFGYVILTNGEKISTEDGLRRLERHKLSRDEILVWHNPEIYCDVLDSIGERDALDTFPVMDVNRADVLYDPKLRNYVHPSLKD